MEEEKVISPEASEDSPQDAKTPWQLQKENWYDKVPLNLKQLDTIIVVAFILLVLVFVVIFLDAADIFNPFGY